MKNRKLLVPVILILLGLASCQKDLTANTDNLYIPTPSDVTATATLDELTQGRSLYIDQCSRCHMLYTPENFSSSQWSSVLNQMVPKTNLTSAEATLVKKYVTKGK